MFVKDVIQAASAITGYCSDDGPDGLFDRITDAVEVLSNKANWDSMQGYLDVTVQDGNVAVLPAQVEYPIKINVNAQPSFSRDKLYEFILNGPGNDMAEVSGNNWMDAGTVPTMRPIDVPTTQITAVTSNAGDNGKTITIVGTNASGTEISETLTLDIGTPPTTTTGFSSITAVRKDATSGTVTLIEVNAPYTQLSAYTAKETDPQYRKIRISVEAPALRILYRRRTSAITSEDDFIPLHSKVALLLMLKSLEHYRKGEVDLGGKLEETAVKFIKEEQESLRNFSLIDATEKQSALNLNYNNADSIIAADVYDDACELFGFVGRQTIFDNISEACELLNNKSIWDGLEGYVDITSFDSNFITLPRYVDSITALNIGGSPTEMRNRWFEFHLNGPGSNCGGSCGSWTDMGDVVTVVDLCRASRLVYTPDLAADAGKTVTVYGYDASDKPVKMEAVGGAIEHVASATRIKRIDRIVRQPTSGFATLTAIDDDGVSALLGYYYPDETEPSYRRIKVPSCGCWVRIRYRKRMLKITSLTDPLHLKSKMAVMMALRSVKFIKEGKYDEAEKAEQKALQYLSEEQQSRHPAETFSFQIPATWGNDSCSVII